MKDTKLIIREIIEKEIEESLDEFDDNELLFDGALAMDSLLTLQIITAFEEYFGIRIEDEDITEEFFYSISNMYNSLQKYLGKCK